MALLTDGIVDSFAGVQRADRYPRVLVNEKRSGLGRGDELQLATLVLPGDGDLFIAGLQSFGAGLDPDLEEVDGLGVRRVEFTVDDPRPAVIR